MQSWLDGYEHIQITDCTGPGTMVGGYNWKIVLHTTESNFGTMGPLVNFFQRNPCSTPQFAIDPGNGRKVQFIPMDWSAAALRGGRNGYQTNRGCAIQVEIIGRAQEASSWGDEVLQFIGEFIADVIRAGAPVNIDEIANFNLSGTLATENSPQRFHPEVWKRFNGICGHVHVPFNDHYDPFNLNVTRIVEFAKASLAGVTIADNLPPRLDPVPAPMPTTNHAPGFLSIGMAGGVVKFAQQLLIGLGYDLGPSGADSDFGPATDRAVKQFQSDHGLDADGIWGPKTRDAVAAAYKAKEEVAPTPEPVNPATPDPSTVWHNEIPFFPGTAARGSSGDHVRQFQQRLADRGWWISVDGDFGPATENIVKAFQAEKGLAVDGIAGPATWNALWSAAIT